MYARTQTSRKTVVQLPMAIVRSRSWSWDSMDAGVHVCESVERLVSNRCCDSRTFAVTKRQSSRGKEKPAWEWRPQDCEGPSGGRVTEREGKGTLSLQGFLPETMGYNVRWFVLMDTMYCFLDYVSPSWPSSSLRPALFLLGPLSIVQVFDSKYKPPGQLWRISNCS